MFYIAMEYIAHGDLGQYITEYGEKAKSEVKEITTQILGGLVVLHEKEICHRDLKPQVNLIPAGYVLQTDHSVEHSHRVSLANMGQNLRFWHLQTLYWNVLKNPLWHILLSIPRAARITAQGDEVKTRLHQGGRYMGLGRCRPRNFGFRNTVS